MNIEWRWAGLCQIRWSHYIYGMNHVKLWPVKGIQWKSSKSGVQLCGNQVEVLPRQIPEKLVAAKTEAAQGLPVLQGPHWSRGKEQTRHQISMQKNYGKHVLCFFLLGKLRETLGNRRQWSFIQCWIEDHFARPSRGWPGPSRLPLSGADHTPNK